METFKVSNLTFRYPETGINVLDDISFSVNKGEFITLCGPSGCGKSTLLRSLKPILAPFGIKQGEILFNGNNIDELNQREQCSRIGYVLQSPDNQIVTDKVWHELAFGLENLGVDNQTIRRHVAETASFFGIQHLFDSNISELSGGQKQLLNLASVMTLQPDVLILDEPTSQLDPIAAGDFLAIISKINRELGTTVIITEHRIEDILSISTRILVMENGRIISYDTPENTGKNLKNANSKIFLSLPAPIRIWDSVCDDNCNNLKCPVTVSQGREWLEKFCKNNRAYEILPEEIPQHSQNVICELKDVWFRYNKDGKDILKNLSFKAYEGEFITILGGNGTGKSTMLSLIGGINKPYRGKVVISASADKKDEISVAALPQNPQELFIKKTVKEDLIEVFDVIKVDKSEKERRINEVVGLCKLKELLHRHPYDLSGGEQQRAALAKILLLRPRLLLLDEPTKGIDNEFKTVFAGIIHTLIKSGVTVIMVSHDVEFCAKYSHRCMMFFNGEIVSEGSPRKFFAANSFYATSANRMSRGILNDAITAEDVIYCCTGNQMLDDFNFDFNLYDFYDEDISNAENKQSIKYSEKLPLIKKVTGVIAVLLLIFGLIINLDYIEALNTENFPFWINFLIIAFPITLLMFSFSSRSKNSVDEIRVPTDKRKIPKRTAAAAVLILLLIPLTIFVGETYLQNQKFIFISLLILFECMIPFFLVFEGRKPQARELVVLAVMCAIAVAGRIAFYMFPQFKPVIAVIIITGIAFGGESGFLVGATAMLISNIMFQQGPWTPWQMFASGIIGFLSGVLFKKGLLSRNRLSMSIFGFIVTVVIYGGIMNFETAVMSNAVGNFNMLMSFFITGFPLDIAHGLATFVFLFFGAEPMLEKLDRIKTKYGLIS